MNKLTLTSLALATTMVMSAQAFAKPPIFFAQGLNLAQAPSAQSPSGSPPSGYPNGRPFQAIKADFEEVKAAIADLDADIAALQADVTMIKTDVAAIKTDVAAIKTDVAAIKTDVAAIKTDVAAIKTDVAAIKTDVAAIKTDVAAIQSDVEALADVLSVQVSVDTAYCAGAGTQCGNFTNEAADDGNSNPVHLIVSVSRGGAPVGGLVEGDFALAGNIVPPGGTGTDLCDSTDCGGSNFGEAATGLYSMFAVTADLSDWDTGVYAGNLSAVDPAGGSGVALVSFGISEAPEAP